MSLIAVLRGRVEPKSAVGEGAFVLLLLPIKCLALYITRNDTTLILNKALRYKLMHLSALSTLCKNVYAMFMRAAL